MFKITVIINLREVTVLLLECINSVSAPRLNLCRRTHRCLTTADTKEDESVIKTGRREEEDAQTGRQTGGQAGRVGARDKPLIIAAVTSWSSPNAFLLNAHISGNTPAFKREQRRTLKHKIDPDQDRDAS